MLVVVVVLLHFLALKSLLSFQHFTLTHVKYIIMSYTNYMFTVVNAQCIGKSCLISKNFKQLNTCLLLWVFFPLHFSLRASFFFYCLFFILVFICFFFIFLLLIVLVFCFMENELRERSQDWEIERDDFFPFNVTLTINFYVIIM